MDTDQNLVTTKSKQFTRFINPVSSSDICQGWIERSLYDELLSQYEYETNTKFVNSWTKSSSFGNTDVHSKSHCIRFEHQNIPYDGVPFIVLNSKKLFCQHGPDTHASEKAKRAKSEAEDGDHIIPRKRKKLLQDSYKFDCPAKIDIKEVVRFQDFKLDCDTVRKRKTASKNVREAIEKGYEGKICYFITLPKVSDHKFHHKGEGASMLFFTDKRIIQKIQEFVINDNIRHVSTMKHLVNNFVRTQLFSSHELPPITNRCYWPTENDLRNHMHRAVMSTRFSKHDQENLESKVKGWMDDNKSDQFFFRPCKIVDVSEESSNSAGLLFVHQTLWQKHLLHRYGQELCLLDATYKTTKYSLPLFFLCVKTNAGYQVVAEFICQDVTCNSIAEALETLSKWNPTWNPSYFMTDFCETEINALERTFSGVRVLICDFHREQCWER